MKTQFHQLIDLAKQKSRTLEDTNSMRNYLNESYQQHEFLNMKNSFERMMKDLEYLGKQGQINPKCFGNILQYPHKFSSSLLSLSKNITQLLQQESKIRISHQHNSSQIIFLALFLRYCQPEKQIKILTTKSSFKNWQKYLIDGKSTDPECDLKYLLSEVKITFHFINQSYKNQVLNSNQILIFDLMNAEVTEYKALFLVLKQSLFMPEKIIVYHSHDQQQDVQSVLNQINIQFFVSYASLTYPIEIEYTEKDSQIKEDLVEFLKEDSNHPQKQDIIIFYKNEHLSNSTAKRFCSKLKQALSDKSILTHVQMITTKNQIIIDGKNHIFIVQNVNNLIEWNYSYSEVFYVIDYGWDVSYLIDHLTNCHVEVFNRTNLKEKTRRISFVGINKVGKYVYNESDFSQTPGYLETAYEVMTYTLRMISFGLQDLLQIQHSRIKSCIRNLIQNKIIRKDQNQKLVIADQDILRLNEQGLDPIHARIVRCCLQKEKEKQKKILTNAIIMTICILRNRGNLRQSRDLIGSKTAVKPTGIWRKSGYLDSCIQILAKAQIIENGKKASRSFSKRKASKINEGEYQTYGNLFQIITPKKMEFQDMQMDDLVRQYFVNETVFAQIRNQIDELRQLFNVQQANIKLENTLLHDIVENLTTHMPYSVAIFSGSRRLGYLYEDQLQKKSYIFPHRDSLVAQLNQTPQFLVILRCYEQEGKRQILMCNHINPDTYMCIFGQLPSRKTDSLAEHQIQFHGISSSIFKGLFRNNGIQMQEFQQQNKCFIQPNEQMATITIYCSKQDQKSINAAFNQLINKIKQKFINYNKIIHYMGNTNVSMSNGGQIKEIIKDNYINSCLLNNLDLEVTQQDLQELFDEFFVLKSIQVLQPQPNKYSKSAVIGFNSQKDYYRFSSYYNQCRYLDRVLDVKPIVLKTTNAIQEQMYIYFKWYVWKSHKKAIVIFQRVQNAQKAQLALKQNPIFDQTNVTFYRDKNRITIDNLNPTVDQIFLQKGFSIYGQIQEVQILKTPLKEPSNQQGLINCLLRETLQIPNNQQVNDRYKIYEVQKHKNGLRKCKVIINKIQILNALIGKLNEVKGKIGQGRLYAQSMFSKPILIAYPSAAQLFQQLLKQTLKEINEQPLQPNLHYSLINFGNNHNYIILRSPLNDTLKYIVAQFQKKLVPFPVDLSEMQKIVILSDIGINNLIDLQQKFNCKLVVNSLKKTLEVICKANDAKKIKQQITARVEDKFFYRVSLNNKSYKHLFKNQTKLQEIKQKYFLNFLQIEEYSKTLIFEGSAHHVQNALNYMMHYIESFSKSEDQLINTQVCLICYEQLLRPYRLQNCGHKFCFGCLDQCIGSALGDVSMFPIKCPHCIIQLTIDDLQTLIDTTQWPRLINMATNQFVNRNTQIMTFCYTPGCKQINMIKLTNFKCDVCTAAFCCDCKNRWHQDMTCEQAKLGVDMLFKRYMQQNGVRVCPNKSCKMPIMRTDGCYRVTCSRCNKSMCFKCDPDKMIAYDDYNLCYVHLNQVHGGYW